jgi:integrase/recombinase XerD
VTILLQRMREELVRRTYSETTIRSYLHAVEAFRQHVGKRLDHLGPDDLRRYQVYLLEDRKLANGTVVIQISVLRFFYIKVWKRRDMKEDLPYPKRLRQLPVVLSPEEVSRLIDCARNMFHRAMLLTMYAAGLRRSELCRLKVSNIDSQRMMLRIERSKNGVDRDVPLSPKLLETLRDYWRWMRPKAYLFPGTQNGWRADKPITPKVIWEAVQQAARRADISEARHAAHAAARFGILHHLSGCVHSKGNCAWPGTIDGSLRPLCTACTSACTTGKLRSLRSMTHGAHWTTCVAEESVHE